MEACGKARAKAPGNVALVRTKATLLTNIGALFQYKATLLRNKAVLSGNNAALSGGETRV